MTINDVNKKLGSLNEKVGLIMTDVSNEFKKDNITVNTYGDKE